MEIDTPPTFGGSLLYKETLFSVCVWTRCIFIVKLFETQTLLTKSSRSTSLFGESGRAGFSGVNIFPVKCCTYLRSYLIFPFLVPPKHSSYA